MSDGGESCLQGVVGEYWYFSLCPDLLPTFLPAFLPAQHPSADLYPDPFYITCTTRRFQCREFISLFLWQKLTIIGAHLVPMAEAVASK